MNIQEAVELFRKYEADEMDGLDADVVYTLAKAYVDGCPSCERLREENSRLVKEGKRFEHSMMIEYYHLRQRIAELEKELRITQQVAESYSQEMLRLENLDKDDLVRKIEQLEKTEAENQRIMKAAM